MAGPDDSGMKESDDIMMDDACKTKKHHLYNQGSTGVFVLLCLLMFIAYLHDAAELMGGFYFGLLILYRVFMGLVVKRYFWRWADEKVAFYSLLTALALSASFLALVLSNTQGN